MDSIGLGDFLANFFIISVLVVSFLGFLFLKKNRNLSFVWLSCSLNIVSLLYFIGTPSYLISIFNIIVWPIINIILIVWYVKKKNR